jgi:4-diphosphocytidyl-2C-methyl-D-erythritol kinase
LTPLPIPEGIWFVVVAPKVAIPRKTASLYARLRLGDLSDGSRVAAQAARLRTGLALDPELFANAFTRPLYDLAPSLADLPRLMREAGAPSVAISGAGPAHYTLLHEGEDADQIAARLRARVGSSADVIVAAPFPARLSAVHGL